MTTQNFELLKKSAVTQIASDLAQVVEQQTQAQINALSDDVKSAISASGWMPAGEFVTGFTFTARNQVGFDASGNTWSYNGSLPFTVPAGTVPSEPTYTNRGDAALRSALADPDSTVLVGGVEAGLNIIPVASIKDLATAPKIDGRQYSVAGFYADTNLGGGTFVYQSGRSWSHHNGYTIIALGALQVWNGTQGDLTTFLNWTGTGNGCFVKFEDFLRDTGAMVMRSQGTKKIKRVFCGIDSLTEGTPNSYTQLLGRFGSGADEQAVFASLRASSVSNLTGFQDIRSIGNRSVYPRNHSLTGDGLYGLSLSGAGFRHLPLISAGVQRQWKKATVYYLQHPNGGTFSFRQWSSDGSSSTGITVNSDGSLLLNTAEISINPTTTQAFTEVFNATGNVTIFGIFYQNSDSDSCLIRGGQGGASAEDWARVDKSTLTRWMELLDINLYVYNGGTNDRFTASPDQLRLYIEPYLQAVASSGCSVLIVEPTQTSDYNSPATKSKKYSSVYRSIADDNKFGFASMVSQMGDFETCSSRFGMAGDGVHPTPAAHFAFGRWLSSRLGLDTENKPPQVFSISGGGAFDRWQPDFSDWKVINKQISSNTVTNIMKFVSGAASTQCYVDIDIAVRVDGGVEYFVEKSLRVYFRRAAGTGFLLTQVLSNEPKAKYVGEGWSNLALTVDAVLANGEVFITASSNFASRVFAKVTDVKVLLGSAAGPAAIFVETL